MVPNPLAAHPGSLIVAAQSYTMRNAILSVLATIVAKVLVHDKAPAAVKTRDQVCLHCGTRPACRLH